MSPICNQIFNISLQGKASLLNNPSRWWPHGLNWLLLKSCVQLIRSRAIVCNDTAKRVKGKWPSLHNGREYLMMKFPDERGPCTTFTPPIHSWECKSCPTYRIISWFFSTNTQFSPVNHAGGDFILPLQPTLHKLSVPLHLPSQCPHAYSNLNMTVLNECYNISRCCLLLGDWATKAEARWKQPVGLLVVHEHGR